MLRKFELMVYRRLFFTFIFAINSYIGLNQSLLMNGELTGIVGSTSSFNSWDFIPFDDAVCQATMMLTATPDVANASGPALSAGIAGHPHSLPTYCSAMIATDFIYIWDEGIQQSVSGFHAGDILELSFYQAVDKQENALDTSGFWRVYLDDSLVLTSNLAVSQIAYNSLDLEWSFQQFQITATDSVHMIKFLPGDDDPNQLASVTDEGGALRMAIDDVHLFLFDPPVIDLGNDTTFCAGASLVLNASYPGSSYQWSDGSTDSVLVVNNPGTYAVLVTNSFGSMQDAITVSYMDAPEVYSIDASDEFCLGEKAELSVLMNESAHLDTFGWNTGSSDVPIVIQDDGLYTVYAANFCGEASDSILVEFYDCSPQLVMPNIFTPNGDATNDVFKPVNLASLYETTMEIFNRWGGIVYFTDELQQGWDGMSRGSEASEGTYFWRIVFTDYQGLVHEEHGFFELRR